LEFNVPFQHKYGYIRDEGNRERSSANKKLNVRTGQCRRSGGSRERAVCDGTDLLTNTKAEQFH